ncbi:R.Pab1 family restriction endonuclease [Campylobacter sputorum]|uniref:R.Pab1 family restriction endonuclease n=1 Tax=Campylobacter sputorum TaxID=206 RepID=UPI000B77DF49
MITCFVKLLFLKNKEQFGTMPMFYFCISLANIKDENGNFSFIGRKIKSKKKGYLQISCDNILMFVKIFKIFGLLRRVYKYYCLVILDYILEGNK